MISEFIGGHDQKEANEREAYPSEMTTEMMAEKEKEGWPRDQIPEQRAGDAQDMAGAILFLVSRAGAYINGNVLITDGGRLSIIPATY